MVHLNPFIPASRKGRVKHADALIRTVFAGGSVIPLHILFRLFLRPDVDISVADLPAGSHSGIADAPLGLVDDRLRRMASEGLLRTLR